MPLNKDVLGMALYNSRKLFDGKTLDEIEQEYGSLEEARIAASKGDAEAIINHFKANGLIKVTVATTGTASAQSGTGTGTIE